MLSSFRRAGRSRLTLALAGSALFGLAPAALASSVSDPSFQSSTDSISAAEVVDEIGFTAVSDLTGGASSITVTAPAGVALDGLSTTVFLHDATANSTAFLTPLVTSSGGRDTATVTVPSTWATGGAPGIAAGARVLVDLTRVRNPSEASTGDWEVSSSEETDPVTAGSQTFAPGALTGAQVYASSLEAGATDVTYTPVFTVTHALRAADFQNWDLAMAGGEGLHGGRQRITFTAPAGASFPAGCPSATVSNTAFAGPRPLTCTDVTGNVATFALDTGDLPTVTQSWLSVPGVTNPSAEGPNTASVRTTADPAGATVPIEITGPPPPSAQTAPAITGTDVAGQRLQTTNGTWSSRLNPLTFARQWQRCDEFGNDCADIAGATGASYKSVADDVGHQLTVVVTATDQRAQATSAAAAPVGPLVAPPPPRGDVLPVIRPATSGAKASLAATPGTWTDGLAPLTYAYQWRICANDGNTCADLAGATKPQLVIVPGLVGAPVRVVVTATDALGRTASATSGPSGVGETGSLVNVVRPAIRLSGLGSRSTLQGDAGTWELRTAAGTTPCLTRGDQRCELIPRWQRCASGRDGMRGPGRRLVVLPAARGQRTPDHADRDGDLRPAQRRDPERDRVIGAVPGLRAGAGRGVGP